MANAQSLFMPDATLQSNKYLEHHDKIPRQSATGTAFILHAIAPAKPLLEVYLTLVAIARVRLSAPDAVALREGEEK